jgi:cell wall-associated NlpC family hydrolase
MASAAQKRGLPAELPVMAALVESGMKNLSGGDADSVGFFQMRVSVWNTGPYAGYSNQPERQLDWFLDQAEAVKRQRLAAGQPIDAKHYGDWVADIERPAAQYRGRYQLRLDDARALLDRAGSPKQGSADQLADAAPTGAKQAGAHALIALAQAKKQLGVPYQWGGSSPKTGFDCSGLVQWAYAKAGIQIPRTSEAQILASNGTPVSRKDLLPGDLVFFRDSTGDVHHVGISLGGDTFIGAPHTGDVVKISSLKEPYYAQQFTGGRRFDHASAPAGRADAASAAARPVDAEAARLAQSALERDAAQVARPGTALHQAIQRQESGKANEVQVIKAVDLLRSHRRTV